MLWPGQVQGLRCAQDTVVARRGIRVLWVVQVAAVLLVSEFCLSNLLPRAELRNTNSGQPKGVRLCPRKQHSGKSRARLYPSSAEGGWLAGPALTTSPLSSSIKTQPAMGVGVGLGLDYRGVPCGGEIGRGPKTLH